MYVTSPRRLRPRLERRLVSPTSREVRERHLTYLPLSSLRAIEWCLRQIRQAGTQGDCIEAGVALGGSGIVIAHLMPPRAEFHGYDVFGLIPPPGVNDGAKPHERYQIIARGESRGLGGATYYGYEENLFDKVVAAFAKFGVPADDDRVSLHRGLFEDTLDLTGRTVAFAHLDCDWYDPVKLCLERIYPVLSPGGFVISDDYYTYDGATRAVDEFLAAHDDMKKIVPWRRGAPNANLILQKA